VKNLTNHCDNLSMRFVRRLTGKLRRLRYLLFTWRQSRTNVIQVIHKQKESRSFTFDVTIVAHLYYLDSAQEILREIHRFKYESGLSTQVLITTTHGLKNPVSDLITDSNLGAKVFAFENRGRDVFPFVKLAQEKFLFNSALVLKIHTKSPRELPTGAVFDHSLALRLLNPEIGNKLFDLAATKEFLSTEKNFCLNTDYLGANLNQIKSLANDVGIENLPSDFAFPAGTIFWATSSIVEKISQLNLSVDQFATEPSPADGTMAHAVERLIGVIASDVGANVVATDDLISQSGAN
jgi:lipopolysaccharide biosynthesis protein